MFNTLTEREAAARIAALRKVDIVMHASPDSDTLGCALAVSTVINANGGDAELVCSDPIPEYLHYILGDTPIHHELRADAERISVDVASPGQLGRFADAAGTISMMIDHHGRGEVFADNTVEADAAACGEIIHRIIKLLEREHGMKIPQKTYDYIYTAISGDTGSFRFANTTAETHRIAAELHELGADTVKIAHELHAVKTRGELAARMLGLANMKFYCRDRLAITSATLEEQQEHGVGAGDFSEADEMRSVFGIWVGVSLREFEPGVWKVSTRANVDIDCSAVCGIYGGGGHKGAAGCTLRGTDRDGAISMLTDAFGRAIEEYEKRSGK